MKKMAVVIPLFKETNDFLQKGNKEPLTKTSSTDITTISGQAIHINQAYQIIKKGKFVGWGRI